MHYKEKNDVPIVDDFAEKYNISRKRAKQAIAQVIRENGLSNPPMRFVFIFCSLSLIFS